MIMKHVGQRTMVIQQAVQQLQTPKAQQCRHFI
jgi:hypothetical protein